MKLVKKTKIEGALRYPYYVEELDDKTHDEGNQVIAIASITVTTSKGVFDGDEKSSNRISNAVRQLTKKDSTKPGSAPHTRKWKMADNTQVDVTADDLSEALDLIADKMEEIIL